MTQQELRQKLLAVIKSPPVRFKDAPQGLDIFYKKPTVEQQGRWLELITLDGKPQLAKMGLAIAQAALECACTESGELLFEPANLQELQAAEADSWVGKLGAMLVKQANGGDDVGKDSGETAAAS